MHVRVHRNRGCQHFRIPLHLLKVKRRKILLPTLDLSKISSVTPPLLYHFQEGCVPAGLFCALVVLLSNKEYKVLVDDPDLPLKILHNNAVSFEVSHIHRIAVTIIRSFYQLEVHYHSSAGVDYLRKYMGYTE